VTGLDDAIEVHAPDLLAGVSPLDLAAAYLRGIEDRPETIIELDHVTVETVTVAETVIDLARTLPGRGSLSFRELIAGVTDRVEIIVRFLAVLELCKLGRVSLGQGTTFGELQIRWVHGSGESFDLGLVDDYAG
jgi:segregation and condensation protein A